LANGIIKYMKSLLQSKTFWFGITQLVIGGVGFFTGILDQQTSSTLMITGLGTIGFRIKTSQPIGGFIQK